MPERFEGKISRKWKELRMNAIKSIFKWAIEQYDKLHDGVFLAFSWGIDDVTDYNVIAERSYPDHNVYGTRVTWYETEPPHEQILKVLKTERECVSRDCDRDCAHCDLSMERSEILSAYDALIAVLAAHTIIPADKEGEG